MNHYPMSIIIRSSLESEWKRAAAIMKAYPRHPNGLTMDEAKNEQWHIDRAAADNAFAAYRNHNEFMVKTFKKEMKDERDARHAARIAAHKAV